MIFECTTQGIKTLEKHGLFSYQPNGVATRGYEIVAYFTEGKPVEGNDELRPNGKAPPGNSPLRSNSTCSTPTPRNTRRNTAAIAPTA